MELIKKIFENSKSCTAIKSLFDDENNKKLILRQAAIELGDYAGCLWKYPYEQIMAITLQAKFADDEEAITVTGFIKTHMRNPKNLFPKVCEYEGLALASRCLISLGFFKEHMEKMTRIRALPPPSFYDRSWNILFF
ncbi:hypothetical protein HYW75_03450 [Candidatus Pacearchaeota archaeon]|nr:hypothetical protein [Candidatus Pacearchaeota archaeon]